MNRFKLRYKRWKEWRKHNANGKLHHILVLLGIIQSPTMNNTLVGYERPTKFFYEDDVFCSTGDVEQIPFEG